MKTMRISLENKISAGFGFALLILCAIGVVSYRNTIELVEAADWQTHTYKVLESLQRLLTNLTDSETGERGYLITNKSDYLIPYRSSVLEVARTLKDLRGLISDNPIQTSRLEVLDSMVSKKLADLEATISLREDKGFEAVLPVFMIESGEMALEDIRKIILEMSNEEKTLLQLRDKKVKKVAENTIITVISAGVLACGLVALSYLVIHRDLVGRSLLEEALRRSHEILEVRVRERTAELAKVNEGLLTEINQRKRAEAELSAFATQLEQRNRELEEFAVVASHDLQEPLRKIQSFGDRLMAKYGALLTDDGRDYLERMQHAAGRMQTLINDLLTLSRITSKGRRFVPVDLTEMTHEVLSDLEIRIEQSEGRVDVGEMPTIEADPVQIRQLLQNLIGNALKFRRSDASPVIVIRGQILDGRELRPEQKTVASDCCQITVEDNGIGFEEKYLDRIFTVFQRLHNRSEYEGTGIGLAVCRRIAERHGGSITARSKPGYGSMFVVTLPVCNRVGARSC